MDDPFANFVLFKGLISNFVILHQDLMVELVNEKFENFLISYYTLLLLTEAMYDDLLTCADLT